MIDADSSAGIKPEIKGNVEIRDIDFVYPSRPSVQVTDQLRFYLVY